MYEQFEDIATSIKKKDLADITVSDIEVLIAASEAILADETGYVVVLAIGGHFTYASPDRAPHFYDISVTARCIDEQDIVIRPGASAETVMKKITDYVSDCDIAMAEFAE